MTTGPVDATQVPRYAGHTIALPLLRVQKERHGPIAVLHFDAHLDTWDTYFGAFLDPAFAPGTGTPEAGGLTSAQLLEVLRGLEGLNIVGADVVEVSPAYDHAEITGIAAHVTYELLSLLAGKVDPWCRHDEAAELAE